MTVSDTTVELGFPVAQARIVKADCESPLLAAQPASRRLAGVAGSPCCPSACCAAGLPPSALNRGARATTGRSRRAG